jgi:hypothetical protein
MKQRKKKKKKRERETPPNKRRSFRRTGDSMKKKAGDVFVPGLHVKGRRTAQWRR